MATQSAVRRIKAMLAQSLQVDLHSPELLFAMASFSKFYSRFYNSCVSTQDGEIVDRHRLVKVPRMVYLILKSLGFCLFQTEDGEAPLMGPGGHPVCANTMSMTGYNLRDKGNAAIAHVGNWFAKKGAQMHGMTAGVGSATNKRVGAFGSQMVPRAAGFVRSQVSDVSTTQHADEDLENKRKTALKQAIYDIRQHRADLENVLDDNPEMVKAINAYMKGNRGLFYDTAQANLWLAKTLHGRARRGEHLENVQGDKKKEVDMRENANTAIINQDKRCMMVADSIGKKVASDEKKRCTMLTKYATKVAKDPKTELTTRADWDGFVRAIENSREGGVPLAFGRTAKLKDLFQMNDDISMQNVFDKMMDDLPEVKKHLGDHHATALGDHHAMAPNNHAHIQMADMSEKKNSLR